MFFVFSVCLFCFAISGVLNHTSLAQYEQKKNNKNKNRRLIVQYDRSERGYHKISHIGATIRNYWQVFDFIRLEIVTHNACSSKFGFYDFIPHNDSFAIYAANFIVLFVFVPKIFDGIINQHTHFSWLAKKHIFYACNVRTFWRFDTKLILKFDLFFSSVLNCIKDGFVKSKKKKSIGLVNY